MIVIAIDGACRRNGKPDCLASGGIFIQQLGPDLELQQTRTLSTYEVGSTNQRGELLALLYALDEACASKQPTQIITDSEYLFNSMTKEWYKSWNNRGWTTAAGDPVKNKDLWLEITHAFSRCEAEDVEVTFYHIKGHCIPFGKVTANGLLQSDPSGMSLYKEVLLKYDSVFDTSKKDLIEQANVLSTKNNGFRLDHETMKRFVVSNVMADAIATKCVDAADALMSR